MKAVQVGILAALLLCAGLLYKVYRGQQPPPLQPVQTASTPAPAPLADVPAAASAAEPSSAMQPSSAKPQAAVSQPEPARKPSSWRQTSKKGAKKSDTDRPPELIAQSAPQAQPAAPAAAPPSVKPETTEVANPVPAPAPPPPAPREPQHVTIPSGTVITVRLAETLSSEKNQTGDSFSATLDQPLIIEGIAIAERGARAQGKIVEAERSGRVKGVARLSLQLLKLHTSDGQDIPLSTQAFAKQAETSHGSDAKKIGIGAALGAAIGAIAGGGKGAAIGAGAGGAAGAGTVAATRGKAAELPVETRLSFRIQEPVTVTERIH